MAITLRYILRTIRERKLRTALLVLSVAVSAGLYFASIALTTSLAGMYADRLQETYGNAEIVVDPHPRGWSSFISLCASIVAVSAILWCRAVVRQR